MLTNEAIVFRFLESNCVAVGTFNIYIIQPAWLREVSLFPDTPKVRVQSDMRQPGFRYQNLDDDLLWNVRPDRFMVESKAWDADCGTPISKVLENLPWTPVRAVGSNVTFRCDPEQANDLTEKMFQPVTIPDAYSQAQRTWHAGLKREDTLTNLQLCATPEHIDLSINVHTEIAQSQSQKKATELAIAACVAYRTHLADATNLAKQLFSIEIEHDLVNAR